MTIATLTTFFGWLAIINIAYLTLAALVLMGMQNWLIGTHKRMFGMDDKDLKIAYFNWLANYKIVTLVFTLAPYIALKLM